MPQISIPHVDFQWNSQHINTSNINTSCRFPFILAQHINTSHFNKSCGFIYQIRFTFIKSVLAFNYVCAMTFTPTNREGAGQCGPSIVMASRLIIVHHHGINIADSSRSQRSINSNKALQLTCTDCSGCDSEYDMSSAGIPEQDRSPVYRASAELPVGLECTL